MKMAFVFDGIGVGGIERVGVDYIRMLTQQKHEIHVYNLDPSAKELEEEIPNQVEINHCKFPRKISPDMYAAASKRWKWGKFVYPLVYLGLNILHMIYRPFRRYKENYDVVIAFSGHFNDLTFVAKNYLLGEKKVCWLHAGLVDYALLSDGYLNLYQRIGNLVVLSSNMEKETLMANKQLQNLNIKKIYNPTYVGEKQINLEAVKKYKAKYGEFLLMVGRFTHEKDQITVIKALRCLKERRVNIPNLVFVGDGEERVKAEQAVEELGMQEHVFFEGTCTNVQDFYKAAHIFVHSSPAEGLPTVLIEAMYFSLPIVATNSLPGVPELLEGERYGLICKVGDEYGMAEKIEYLLDNEKEYQRFQQQENIRIKDFMPECIAEQMKNFLERC